MTSALDEKEIAPDRRKSACHRQRALRHVAFGVSSTPRATQLPLPLAIASARDAEVVALDGNSYIDFALGYGPLILGHSPAAVIEAVTREMGKGLRTASNHEGEAELAELLAATVHSAEISAFVSSGTEAVQLALRIARARTGRLKVIKFRFNYHGWSDGVHVAMAPGHDGAATIGQDPAAAQNIIVVDWGDADGLERVLSDEIAAVLMEPAAVNAGCFAPPPGYLQRVRELTRHCGALLIFDEIITGYRLSLGGAQQKNGVFPDLTILGKAMGAGFPISCVSGTQDARQPVSSGRLLHRGTFNGNPVSVAASIACLKVLQQGAQIFYPRMEAFAVELKRHVESEAGRMGALVCAGQVGASVQIFAGVRSLARIGELAAADREAALVLTGALLRRGIQTLPRGLMYLSTVHTAAQIEQTKQGISSAMEEISN